MLGTTNLEGKQRSKVVSHVGMWGTMDSNNSRFRAWIKQVEISFEGIFDKGVFGNDKQFI